MATRFYLPSSGAAAVSPAFSSEWEHQNTIRRQMSPTKTNTTILGTIYTPDTSDHLVDQDALVIQFVSEPLAAQTIAAQTLKVQIQCTESNAGNNLFLTWKVFVCSNDGTTIKETLLAIKRDGLEMATSPTNRSDSATSTAADVEDGDRIVLELGAGGLPTAAGGTQGHNSNLRFLDDSATDLPENDTDTTTTKNPWFEFANDLTFQTLTTVKDIISMGLIPFAR